MKVALVSRVMIYSRLLHPSKATVIILGKEVQTEAQLDACCK
jgi:hypothetical protein